MAGRDTRASVAHLFRRAGFGLTPTELDHFTGLGVQGSVESLLKDSGAPDPADMLYPIPDLTQFSYPLVPPEKRTTELIHRQGQLRNQAKEAIQVWWINRMLSTSHPLREKMTLFWHGHFATGVGKAPPVLMLQQNQLIRTTGLENFLTLLLAVNQDPAMLLWLDGASNRAGKPNENFSRELMELFTLGVGSFTETDVREGARALTGWSLSPGAIKNAVAGQPSPSRFVPRYFDSGVKSYLGQSGAFGANDVMQILTASPHAGPFLARKIFHFFAYDNPSDADIAPLVSLYYTTHYDIKAMVQYLLLSDAFYSDQAFDQHIKSPAEFVVSMARELGGGMPASAMSRAMTLMGQELFYPPNVGGWPGGVSWINEGTLVERFNFAGQFATYMAKTRSSADLASLLQQQPGQDNGALVDSLLSRFVGVQSQAGTRAALVSYLGGSGSPQSLNPRLRGLLQLLFATPEYQLT